MHQDFQFLERLGGSAGQVLIHLRPQELDRIEFWGVLWEAEQIQARLSRDEVLHFAPGVAGRTVPQQDDQTSDLGQQVTQELQDMIASHVVRRAFNPKPKAFAFWRDDQPTDQVQPVVMVQTGANARCLPDWGPGALERRNQRKTRLIQQNQGRPQVKPLFLSVAIYLFSTG